jgi:hypothetical protein
MRIAGDPILRTARFNGDGFIYPVRIYPVRA